MDPAVKKETGYIAVWVILLSLIMEAVFLLLRKWDLSVLFGNLGGAVISIGNFFLMALIATRAMNRGVESGKPEEAAARVKATAMVRLLGCVLLCVLLIVQNQCIRNADPDALSPDRDCVLAEVQQEPQPGTGGDGRK